MHAPGPWKWAQGVGGGDEWQLEGNVEYPDMSPILIAFDCGCKVDKEENQCPLSPCKDDRDLIAEAPDMLVALKAILASPHRSVDAFGYTEVQIPDPIWQAAQEAVRRAKGGA